MNITAPTSLLIKTKLQKSAELLLTILGLAVMSADAAIAQTSGANGFCWFINNFKLIVAGVAVIAIMVWGIMYMLKKAEVADVAVYILTACGIVGSAYAIISGTGLLPPTC